ncbi:hypothetical protein NC651_022116 [Populus alba x Populus x berolinensis]|nr:hypothetical protein NC651_022116 [Populus alba x Populus x berolinensis]
MYRDVSSCNTTIMETPCTGTRDTSRKLRASIGTKHYSSLRPFVRLYIPTSSRVLMVGCGNALNVTRTWLRMD